MSGLNAQRCEAQYIRRSAPGQAAHLTTPGFTDSMHTSVKAQRRPLTPHSPERTKMEEP
jgi:hypothetical protein